MWVEDLDGRLPTFEEISMYELYLERAKHAADVIDDTTRLEASIVKLDRFRKDADA
jgi:hypothetical protein